MLRMISRLPWKPLTQVKNPPSKESARCCFCPTCLKNVKSMRRSFIARFQRDRDILECSGFLMGSTWGSCAMRDNDGGLFICHKGRKIIMSFYNGQTKTNTVYEERQNGAIMYTNRRKKLWYSNTLVFSMWSHYQSYGLLCKITHNHTHTHIYRERCRDALMYRPPIFISHRHIGYSMKRPI